MDPDEITPPQFRTDRASRNEAADLIRTKLNAIYKIEPNAKEEIKEVKELVTHHDHLSKHQKYMKSLTDSGKNVAEVQTAWHEYYQCLSDAEKHEVWQEFYSEHEKKRAAKKHQEETVHHPQETDKPKPATHKKRRNSPLNNIPLPPAIYASSKKLKKLKKNKHVKSLSFGLGIGGLVVFIMMFSFFNERIIIPFIRPSQNVSATPIIIDPTNTGPVGPESLIIIPKINIETPVVYDVPSLKEEEIQTGLENGIVHYPTTPMPGQSGNSVMFGHSSGNILNKGKYKFAFLLLKSLEVDDTFIVQKDGKRYVYKVFNEFVTTPEDFSVLGDLGRPTMTLITCDPPGTSTNRLIIQAEQIFPDPSTNTAATTPAAAVEQPAALPSNSQSLWQRIFN